MGTLNRIGNWFQNTGTRYNLPELHLSEIFGVSPTQVEKTAAYQKELVNSGKAHWVYNSDGTQSLVEGPTPTGTPTGAAADTNTGTTTNRNTSRTSTTSGNTADQLYVPNINYYNGVAYDLNNQDDYRRLLEAQMADLDAQNRDSLGTINRNLFQTTGFNDRSGDITLNNVSETSDIGKQKKTFLDQIVENLTTLADQEKANTQNINAYYSGLGDITQSSQAYRLGEEASKFAKSRDKVNEQKTAGLNSLERALSDFLYSDTQSREQLARDYSTKRDAAMNQTADALSKVGDQINNLKLEYANAVYNGQDPTYIKEAIDANTNIFNALNTLRTNNIFKRIGGGSGVNTEAILQYLNPQAA